MIFLQKRPTTTPQREWQYGITSALCLSLGTACLTLAACSTAPKRNPQHSSFAQPLFSLPPAEFSTLPENPQSEKRSPFFAKPSSIGSPWDRLRQRFMLPGGCDYQPEVMRWARIYTANPETFTASLSNAMPFLLLVVGQLEQLELPGEFSMLPYVESTYTPFIGRGNNPAGIWQFIPETGKEFGLKIHPYYDGRLDIYASTLAATTLLTEYQKELGDWRLVNMAFNAGKFHVKKLVATNSRALSAAELSRLKFSSITHEHLTKLFALKCIISEPERFKVTLPEPKPEDTLQLIKFEAPVSFRLAAQLTGLSEARIKQLNPAYLYGRMFNEGPYQLLLPAIHTEKMHDTLANLPDSQRADWRWLALKAPTNFPTLARTNNIDANLLAKINRIEAKETFPAGTKLLIPGRDPADKERPFPGGSLPSGVHVVRAGDTLWAIARQYRVRLEDLLRWNGVSGNTVLKLGQKLKLSQP